MDLSYAAYLLFVVPGFCLVWTYRHFTESGKIGEFEYAAWSFLWGVVVFVLFCLIVSWEHISFPPVPLNDLGALLGSLVGISIGLALGGAFAFGFIGATLSRLGLFQWIDKQIFHLLDKSPVLVQNKLTPDRSIVGEPKTKDDEVLISANLKLVKWTKWLAIGTGAAVIVALFGAYINYRFSADNLRQELRPVILQDIRFNSSSSLVDYWQQFRNGTGTIMFSVYNNIATNISGFMVVDNQKINLDFALGNLINQNEFSCPISIFQGSPVEWIPNNTLLCGYLNGNPTTTFMHDNEIHIQYEAIDGTVYSTNVDNNLSPTVTSL